MQTKFLVWFGIIMLVAFSILLLACGGSSAGTGILFVAAQGDAQISRFSVNLKSGILSAKGSGLAVGPVPNAALLAPGGGVLFVLNGNQVSQTTGNCSNGSCAIYSFTVNNDGTLTAGGTTPVSGVAPVSMAMDASGQLLFVASQGDDTQQPPIPPVISIYQVSGTTLTEQTSAGSPVLLPHLPSAVAIPKSGSFLYVANSVVANSTTGTVSAYAFDSTGALTPIFNPPSNEYNVGSSPSGLVLTAQKDGPPFLYVANFVSNDVYGFTACTMVSTACLAADGSLVPVTDTKFSAGNGPLSMAVDPTNNFLYVTDYNSNQVSVYVISRGTGKLSPANTSATSTGANPIWVAVHPAGKFAYVANNGGASVSQFSVNTTTGVLGVVGEPVTTAGQPSALVLK